MKFLKKLFGSGKSAVIEDPSDRYQGDVSYDLTPEKINSIMNAANMGDIRGQVQLSAEILEKNADIAQALNTRKDAVLGLPWHIQGGDDPQSKAAAVHLEEVLRDCGDAYGADSFSELLSDMLAALLPGFAVSEILWLPGGGIKGFRHIRQCHFTFADGFIPRLRTDDEPSGILLPREKIIYNNARVHGSDPARGGLIRPLVWLHCFKHIGEKDLLSFIERHGMPFIAAKVDPASFEREKNLVKRLIRNFGSSGGGVFTHSVELQLLECRNNGEAYFRLLEYLAAAVNKVILGQNASSGESSGWSKGDAQSQVRQDILESDCAKLMRLVNTQLIRPWMNYNYGSTVKLPRFEIDFKPPEDKEKLSGVIKTLYDAGFELSPEDAGNLVGLKLKRRVNSTIQQDTGSDDSNTLNLKQKYDAMGVAIRAGLLTATPEIEAQTRAELGLPVMSIDVEKAWAATGGIRQPITLKAAEAAAVADVQSLAAEQIEKSDTSNLSDALTAWLGPVAEALSDVSDLSDVSELSNKFGSSQAFENTIARELLKARKEGAGDESQN